MTRNRAWVVVVASALAGACAPSVTAELPVAPTVDEPGAVVEVNLVAAVSTIDLAGRDVEVWAYNGQVPGPTVRARPGDRVIVTFRNELPEPTTVHWHGLRVSNAMDGVPAVMTPVEPGEEFRYELDVPDVGTYWYHPHVTTHHQVDRGLYGGFIVGDDPAPLLVVDDWSLNAEGQLRAASPAEDFWGRTGELVTINSQTAPSFSVDPETRRVRVLNGSNATPFVVSAPGPLRVVAKDGPALDEPVEVTSLLLAPGERADVEVVDAAEPSLRFAPVSRGRVMMGEGDVGEDARWTVNGAAFPDVPPIKATEGDLVVLEIANNTGLAHPLHLHGHFFRVLARSAGFGLAVGAPAATATLRLDGAVGEELQRPALASFVNAPGTLTGVRLGLDGVMGMGGMGGMGMMAGGLSVDEVTALERAALHDTVLLEPMQRVRIALVADNPGTWMYHCHVLEHEEAGMMGTFVVQPR